MVAVLLAIVFAIVAVTKFMSGDWQSYLAISAYGLGAFGCAQAARLASRHDLHALVGVGREVAIALGLAAAVLVVFAVWSVGDALDDELRSGLNRSVHLVLSVLDGIGAAGCLIAARSYVARDDHAGDVTTVR